MRICSTGVEVFMTTHAPGIEPTSITGPMSQNRRHSTLSRTDHVWNIALMPARTLMMSTPATGPSRRLSTGAPMRPRPMPEMRCMSAPTSTTARMTMSAMIPISMG